MNERDGAGSDTVTDGRPETVRDRPTRRSSDVATGKPAAPAAGNDQLRQDQLRLDLLAARDAYVGVRAERAAARSMVRDLELQVHMLILERDDLRLQNEQLERRIATRTIKGRSLMLVKRLFRGALV